MNQEVKEKWLTALKSGEYTKGRGTLKHNNQFCCLGVLCDLYKKETGIGEWSEIVEGEFILNYERAVGVLSERVMNWAGLKSGNPETSKAYVINHTTYFWSIAEINDTTETFKEVIEEIEKF